MTLREQIAQTIHDSMFEERWCDLTKDGIERAMYLQAADEVLALLVLAIVQRDNAARPARDEGSGGK